MSTVMVAYTPEPDVKRAPYGWGEYQVIDAMASAGKEYPVVIGHVSVIRGFLHYTGNRAHAHRGVKAVITSTYVDDNGKTRHGDIAGAITKALRNGLRNGRDDRRSA